MTSHLRRITASAATCAGILAATLCLNVGGAWAQPADSPADSAAAWLITQLAGSDHLSDSYGPSYGLTADLAIALSATGTQDATLRKVVSYLGANVADYADPAGTGPYGGPFGGATGKLALVAEITGQNPRSFGGFDLLDSLTTHVCTAATSDYACTAAGDFHGAYSGISQSLGVLALARADVPVPAAALTRLLSLQCPSGGFSSVLITPGSACTADVDTTGYAMQALVLLDSQSAQTAVTDAATYLLGAQGSDGSFTGASGANAQSTTLAAQGLIVAESGDEYDSQISSALEFAAGLQQSDGGIAINHATAGSDVRATAGSIPALTGQTLSDLDNPLGALADPTPVPTATPAATATPTATSTGTPTATPIATPSPTATAAAGARSSSTGASALSVASSTATPATSGVEAASYTSTATGTSLASTGVKIGGLFATGVMLLVAGAFLLVLRRRLRHGA